MPGGLLSTRIPCVTHNGNNGIPSPWTYYNIPEKDANEFLSLYLECYGTNPVKLPQVIEKVLYPPGRFVNAYPRFQAAEAVQAAQFFVIADFIAQYYQKQHPNFRMKETPPEVLKYLRPPFNRMIDLNYDIQKRFMKTLSQEELAIFRLEEG